MDDLLADELRDCDTDDDNPDGDRDRGRALLDAAEHHLLHHQPERAVALWQRLINEGGEYADDASVEYAGHLFRHSRGDGARAVLHKVMTKGRTDTMAWLKAALLLEAHGHLV
jgi:lipopolysaccharide biosynthesis regulator YciM